MSGITGIFRRDGKDVDPADIKKMNDKIAHRGPDGSKVWCEGPVALGHQMLHTTHESLHETLPFEDEESGLIITADARIDNRNDLAPQLGIEDNEYVSDSYFILKAYEKWGENCPEKLLGDFAFVIWDKSKQQLFCARDHMGVKPFYYYLSDKIFYFSTEMKTIFLNVKKILNKIKLSFFLMGYDDHKLTFYENVLRLFPAHFLNITNNSVKMNKYWELNPNSKIVYNSEDQYIKAFQEIFVSSVYCRMRSNFPIGFELSGGLDSSSVLCVAKKIYDSQGSLTNINSFSLIFHKHDERDEKTYIDSITNFVNTTPIFIYGDTINLLDDVDNILSHQEQPLMIPNIRIIWELYNKMEHQGIRVSLGGSGGDSIISFGHYYFRDLFISFKWKKLLKEIYYYSKTSNKKIFNIFLYNLVFVLIPLSIKKLVKKHQTIIPGPIVLNKKFSKQLNAEKCWENFSLDYFKANTAKKNHLHAIENANIYMLEMRDRASAVFSIEQRYPFLDKRLVEFCYSIPTEMKFKYGWNRYILRLAMEGILPEMNQWRTDKANLNSLYKENMLLEKNNLNKIFLSKNNLIEHYINYDKITEIYRNFINGIQVSDSPYSIWLIYQLYQWLKKEKLI